MFGSRPLVWHVCEQSHDLFGAIYARLNDQRDAIVPPISNETLAVAREDLPKKLQMLRSAGESRGIDMSPLAVIEVKWVILWGDHTSAKEFLAGFRTAFPEPETTAAFIATVQRLKDRVRVEDDSQETGYRIDTAFMHADCAAHRLVILRQDGEVALQWPTDPAKLDIVRWRNVRYTADEKPRGVLLGPPSAAERQELMVEQWRSFAEALVFPCATLIEDLRALRPDLRLTCQTADRLYAHDDLHRVGRWTKRTAVEIVYEMGLNVASRVFGGAAHLITADEPLPGLKDLQALVKASLAVEVWEVRRLHALAQELGALDADALQALIQRERERVSDLLKDDEDRLKTHPQQPGSSTALMAPASEPAAPVGVPAGATRGSAGERAPLARPPARVFAAAEQFMYAARRIFLDTGIMPKIPQVHNWLVKNQHPKYGHPGNIGAFRKYVGDAKRAKLIENIEKSE